MASEMNEPPDGETIVIIDDRAGFLAGLRCNIYSQFGEDGLSARALEYFGETNRWCFEVGAADGEFFSNTLRLIECGWHSVQIEQNVSQWSKLVDRHKGNTNVACLATGIMIDHTIDETLAMIPACPADLDFDVIDVDGLDHAAWAAMTEYRPRLMLIEFARESDNSGQAKFHAIIDLGRAKGYAPLAATYVNILFCLEAML